jgi:hypothetical protein
MANAFYLVDLKRGSIHAAHVSNHHIQPGSKMKCAVSFRLVVAALIVVSSAGGALGQEDEYLRIYGVIEQADSLNAKQPEAALAKYREAQAGLRNLQRDYRDWNPKVVAYRLNYLAEKISVLSAKQAGSAASGTTGASSGSTAQVKLLEAGAEPRKALRLHPKAGDKQTLLMTMKTDIATKLGEQETPPMKMPATKTTMEVTVKSVSAEGDIAYEMAVTEASVSEESEVTPAVAEAVKASLANLKGLSATGTMSHRGFSKGSQVKVPAGMDPQTRRTMDQMADAFSRGAVVFPEEAIGPGAKWEAKLPLESQGIKIDQIATYELASIEGERLIVSTSILQSAANQKIENPAMPGLKVDLTKMTGTGTGGVTLELGQLLPLEASLESQSDLSMAMDLAGQKQAMTMKMGLNVRLEVK